MQVWYKFPHQSEVHLAQGVWQSKVTQNAYVIQSFQTESTLILDLGEKECVSLDLFDLSPEQIFELPQASPIREVNYVQLVKNGIQSIIESKFSKVVLARQKQVVSSINPLILFKAICRAYENCFVHLVYEPNKYCSIGASPELLLSNDESGVKSASMAGTVIDGSESFTEKESKEQAFVTEYIISKFKARGIQPEITNELIRNNRVQHLYSMIESRQTLNREGAYGLLNELHPTPAVCGFPMAESKDFILKHEGFDRSWYSGYMGVLERNEVHMYVNLRCARLYEGKVLLYSGAGITKDSNPEAEFLETEAKMEAIGRFL